MSGILIHKEVQHSGKITLVSSLEKQNRENMDTKSTKTQSVLQSKAEDKNPQQVLKSLWLTSIQLVHTDLCQLKFGR